MKVRDLISTLSAFDSEQDVLCCCEDEELLPPNHGFRLFEINGVEQREAEKIRDKEGLPSLKLDKTHASTPHILIDITSDF